MAIKKKYDKIVFIGRFQPLHNAHVETIKVALSLADKVIIILGSSDEPSTFKNPFSDEIRENLIFNALGKLYIPDHRYELIRQPDNLYSDVTWFTDIQEKVQAISQSTDKIGIIGYNKDESSYYLHGFPQWEQIPMPKVEHLSASDIRDLYFVETPNLNFIKGVVPSATYEFLEDTVNDSYRMNLVKERRFVEKYKLQFQNLPYPPIFVTTDAVVIQSGHILMIRRKAYPGNGLLALPGGFVNANTDASLEDAMIRELKEETRIRVPPKILRSSIKKTKVFDAIQRSTRGRTITHAFNIILDEGELPKVRASSDASDAFWIPINDVKRSECYEDHFHIISYFI